MGEMLISEFARRAGLSVDTVRYYVRLGLLTPGEGRRGGRNPYMEFTGDDLDMAGTIRVGQMFGLSLKEIASFLAAGEEAQLTRMRQHRDALRQRAAELRRLTRYLDEKIAWIESGMRGAAPALVLAPGSPGHGPRRPM